MKKYCKIYLLHVSNMFFVFLWFICHCFKVLLFFIIFQKCFFFIFEFTLKKTKTFTFTKNKTHFSLFFLLYHFFFDNVFCLTIFVQKTSLLFSNQGIFVCCISVLYFCAIFLYHIFLLHFCAIFFYYISVQIWNIFYSSFIKMYGILLPFDIE